VGHAILRLGLQSIDRAAPIPLEWDVFFDLRGLELAFLNRYLRRLEPPRALALVLKELDEGFPISLDERSAPLTDWPPVDSVSDFVPILESVPEAIEAFLDRLLGKEPWSLKRAARPEVSEFQRLSGDVGRILRPPRMRHRRQRAQPSHPPRAQALGRRSIRPWQGGTRKRSPM
jgi:hypothetical protein